MKNLFYFDLNLDDFRVLLWSGGQGVRVLLWSGGQVVRWSGCQVVRWSGGQVVRWSEPGMLTLAKNVNRGKEC